MAEDPTRRRLPQRVRMTPSISRLTLPLVLGAALVSCGGDQPAVCGSANSLETSIQDLKDVDVKADGLSAVQSQLTTIKGDLADLKKDAESEFSAQIKAVDTSYSALKASAATATSDPSATNLAAVATAVSALVSEVKTLVNDVESTC